MHLHKEVDEKKIKEAFKKFLGKIKQIPPIRSAVKRQEREREVYYIEILEILDQDILFKIGCQAGTYVRKWVHDVGKFIGCGAHLVQLVRTKVGLFVYENSFTLHDLKDAYEFLKEGDEKKIRSIIRPFEEAVEHLGKVWILDGAVDAVCHGSDLYVAGVAKLSNEIKIDDIVAIMTLKDELVGVGKVSMNSENLLKENKGIAVTKTKIFMERGTYKI